MTEGSAGLVVNEALSERWCAALRSNRLLPPRTREHGPVFLLCQTPSTATMACGSSPRPYRTCSGFTEPRLRDTGQAELRAGRGHLERLRVQVAKPRDMDARNGTVCRDRSYRHRFCRWQPERRSPDSHHDASSYVRQVISSRLNLTCNRRGVMGKLCASS